MVNGAAKDRNDGQIRALLTNKDGLLSNLANRLVIA